METIGINSKWSYDEVIVLPQLDDDSLAVLQRLLNDIGDAAYVQGYNAGLNDNYKESGCNECAFEDVDEWNMPCAKCKRGCKDYWRKKA